jgi:hypothetical protein
VAETNKIVSLVNETKASCRRGRLEGKLLNIYCLLSVVIFHWKLFNFVPMALYACSITSGSVFLLLHFCYL